MTVSSPAPVFRSMAWKGSETTVKVSAPEPPSIVTGE